MNQDRFYAIVKVVMAANSSMVFVTIPKSVSVRGGPGAVPMGVSGCPGGETGVGRGNVELPNGMDGVG